jgi:hypothetical protein
MSLGTLWQWLMVGITQKGSHATDHLHRVSGGKEGLSPLD